MTAPSATLHSAIVGLETWFDGFGDRVSLERAIYRGEPAGAGGSSRSEEAPLVDRAIADANLGPGVRLTRLSTTPTGSAMPVPSFLRGIQEADRLLLSNQADAVVLIDSACAIVLVGRDRVPKSRRAYALLESIACVEDVRWSVELALGEAQLEGRDVGYVDLTAVGDRLAALDGVASALRGEEPTCAVGSAAFGQTAAAGVLQAAFCLQRRYLPRSASVSVSSETPFFVPDESRPFFAFSGQRRALVVAADGGMTWSLVLAEHAPESPALPAYDPVAPLALLSLCVHDAAEMTRALDACEGRLAAGESPSTIAAELLSRRGDAPLAVAIVGRDRDGLRAELRAAKQGIPQALATGIDWQTPGGSSFSPRPQGRDGKVAFVYPGAFSGYVGLGRDAFRLFPWLHEPGHGLPRDLGATFSEALLYPRFRGPASADDRATAELRLYEDHIAMFSASAAASVLFTRVAGEVFGIRPQIAFGYSLGEGIMFSATGVWNDPDLQRERLQASELFRTRLAGPREALHAFWRSRGVATRPGPAPWATWLVKTPVDRLRATLQGAKNVFLTIINTPGEAIIGGLPEECAQLVAALQCEAVRLPYAQLLHSEVVATEEEEIARQHSFPFRGAPATAFYSATSEQPLALDPVTLPRALARMAREQLDFPRLVDRVWQAGARVFVELGGGTSCSRLIAANLQGRPHVTIAIDRRNVDVETSIIRCLARLYSHRVPINLSRLQVIS